MNEWLSNPPWWLNTMIGAAMPYVFKKGLLIVRGGTKVTTGRLKRYSRNRQAKALKKIRALRFDSFRIIREISLSHTFLAIFILSGLVYMLGLFIAAFLVTKESSNIVIWGTSAGVPSLIFEFCWLATSARVELLLKIRKKLNRNQRKYLS